MGKVPLEVCGEPVTRLLAPRVAAESPLDYGSAGRVQHPRLAVHLEMLSWHMPGCPQILCYFIYGVFFLKTFGG